MAHCPPRSGTDCRFGARRRSFRRLPVIDKAGRIFGLVTLDDILMLLAEEFTHIGDILGKETPQAAAVAG